LIEQATVAGLVLGVSELEEIGSADFRWGSIDDSCQSIIRVDYVSKNVRDCKASCGVCEPVANLPVRGHGMKDTAPQY
jgi:hypothetical protein